MSKVSRRSLAGYAADELLAGKNATTLAKQLAAILVESGRAGDSEFLLSDTAWELEQRRALTIGRVTSATPLAQPLQTALKAQLKKATQAQEIVLQQELDKSVIGGIKVETSGEIWDKTIARKLTELREAWS